MADATRVCQLLCGDASDDDKVLLLRGLCSALEEQHDAHHLAARLRESGICAAVAALVNAPARAVHQPALCLLANLTTHEVDAHAEKTIALLAEGINGIVAHLFSDVALTVCFAVAVLQNCCANQALAIALVHHGGVVQRLRELNACANTQISQSASQCLHNLTVVVSRLHAAQVQAALKLQRSVRRYRVRQAACRPGPVAPLSLATGNRIRALPSLAWA